MARLILVNGAPGSGKSTVAEALAQRSALALALDVDALKHALGGWDDDRSTSGLHARRLALAVAAEQLASGHDVVVGQYLARTEFIEQLEALAERHAGAFVEFVLDLDAPHLAARLQERAATPTRPEHAVHNRTLSSRDAEALVASLAPLRTLRPHAIWIDATGSLPETLAILEPYLDR